MQNMKQHVKTLLATLCLLILCGAQRTEAQQHLTFQGISFDNSFQAFGKALVAQGYEMDEEDNDFFYGKFLGEEATLLLAQTPKTHRTSSLVISSAASYTDVKECAKVAGAICGQLEELYNCSIEIDEENTSSVLHSYGFLENEDGTPYGYISVNVTKDDEEGTFEWNVYFSDHINENLYSEEGGE